MHTGEQGRAVNIEKEKLSKEERKKFDVGWEHNAFNEYASQLISLHRSLPDVRDPEYARHFICLPITTIQAEVQCCGVSGARTCSTRPTRASPPPVWSSSSTTRRGPCFCAPCTASSTAPRPNSCARLSSSTTSPTSVSASLLQTVARLYMYRCTCSDAMFRCSSLASAAGRIHRQQPHQDAHRPRKEARRFDPSASARFLGCQGRRRDVSRLPLRVHRR